jgi:hypothetical protein
MDVQMPLRILLAISRLLVKTHGVGKRCLEQVIITGGQPLEKIG